MTSSLEARLESQNEVVEQLQSTIEDLRGQIHDKDVEIANLCSECQSEQMKPLFLKIEALTNQVQGLNLRNTEVVDMFESYYDSIQKARNMENIDLDL